MSCADLRDHHGGPDGHSGQRDARRAHDPRHRNRCGRRDHDGGVGPGGAEQGAGPDLPHGHQRADDPPWPGLLRWGPAGRWAASQRRRCAGAQERLGRDPHGGTRGERALAALLPPLELQQPSGGDLARVLPDLRSHADRWPLLRRGGGAGPAAGSGAREQGERGPGRDPPHPADREDHPDARPTLRGDRGAGGEGGVGVPPSRRAGFHPDFDRPVSSLRWPGAAVVDLRGHIVRGPARPCIRRDRPDHAPLPQDPAGCERGLQHPERRRPAQHVQRDQRDLHDASRRDRRGQLAGGGGSGS